MRKILKYVVLGWLGLSVVTAPLYWPYLRMLWVFLPKIAAPDYPAPSSEAEARRQDLDYLSTLTNYDRAFSDAAKTAFSEKLAGLDQSAEDMTDAEFYLGLAEAVALADNGHTSVSYTPQYREFRTIGARFHAFEDGLYITDAAPDKAGALGSRVLAIAGYPVETLQTELGRYKGGNSVWRTLYSTLIMESPDLLAAAGFARSSDGVDLLLEAPDGTQETLYFEALTMADPKAASWRSAWLALLPGRASTGFEGWSHVKMGDDSKLPRYLTQTDQALSYAMDGNGHYIRALPGFKVGDRKIKTVYKSILADIPDGSLDYLVVDFRLHDGGDYTKSIAFSKAAPKAVKEDGAIYIITGPNTFSAAIVTTAMLKYHAGDRGQIIGEPMGDREAFWAERGSTFQLPNSGYYINYATGFHDWEKGCKGTPYCYTMNEMHEVPAGSLAPTTHIPLRFDSYMSGDDDVLNWIAERH